MFGCCLAVIREYDLPLEGIKVVNSRDFHLNKELRVHARLNLFQTLPLDDYLQLCATNFDCIIKYSRYTLKDLL